MKKYSHFILYAKGFYKKSGNLLQDMKHIVSNYSGVNEKHISSGDVFVVMTEIAFHFIGKNLSDFQRYTEDVSAGGYIYGIIKMLNSISIENMEISYPDPSVLPLSEEFLSEVNEK